MQEILLESDSGIGFCGQSLVILVIFQGQKRSNFWDGVR